MHSLLVNQSRVCSDERLASRATATERQRNDRRDARRAPGAETQSERVSSVRERVERVHVREDVFALK